VARLLSAASLQGLERVWPFWGDGGPGPSTPLAPARHVIAAMPSRVERARLDDLRAIGLEAWLRQRLEGCGPVPLHVVGLTYEAGMAARANADGLAYLEAPDTTRAALVVTYPGYLVGASERGPWQAVGDCQALFEALEVPAVAMPLRPAIGLDDEVGEKAHLASILEIKEGIARGDFYQVNLARRLEGPCPPDAASALYFALRAAQPTAYGALWALGASAWLASGSPECLLRWDARTRQASTFPIKGTAPRRPDDPADAALSEALHASEKDRAEHVMIVDLARNDLGRVAVVGGVSVPQAFAELPLATVRHLVSEVTCEVAAGYDLADLLGTLFPGGSITGAPRIAAMKAIARHEPGPRGFYCGSLGVVFGEEEATFSILIRTAVVADGRVTYWTGGGIVADSDPESEWRETELKAEALRRALGR
jgi:para-aminobenzoate synthetase component 1